MHKKMLYLRHKFHSKTKSNDFLVNLLKEKYDIETFEFDPYEEDASVAFSKLNGKYYDVLLLFQIMPNIDDIKKNINFKSGVFFPMYDAAINEEAIRWQEYREFNIINFSKTLHEQLKRYGLSSYYIQYFPKPANEIIYGDEHSAFLWQRLTGLNYNYIHKFIKNFNITNVHIHKSLDPNQEFVAPKKKIKAQFEYSTWYNKKEDMLKDIKNAAIYIAPRFYEGIGHSFLEAMAMGKCVVSPDNPTMNEYIEHNKTGFLYPSFVDKLKPIKNVNIKEVQRNTYEFIKLGYEKWEQNKHKILDWIEAPLYSDFSEEVFLEELKKLTTVTTGYLFKKIPVIFIENRIYAKIKTYKIFNMLPILKVKDYGYKVKFSSFGIPIWKITID